MVKCKKKKKIKCLLEPQSVGMLKNGFQRKEMINMKFLQRLFEIGISCVSERDFHLFSQKTLIYIVMFPFLNRNL